MSVLKRTRPRVIYQNEFLYSSLDATGYHFNHSTKSDPDCSLRNIDWESCSGNQVRQLHRIQAINYSSITNLIDINQYGSAAHIGALSSDTPDVTLDIEYLLSEGYNEQVMGFITDGESPALHKHLMPDGRVGQNFFIVTVPHHHDVVNYDFENNAEDIRVIGIGNAFLTQYAITAEVGSIPKARASFEAFNMVGYTGYCNLPVPSVDYKFHGCKDDIRFSIPDTYQSFVYGKVTGMEDIDYREANLGIAPRNIEVSFKNGSYISVLPSGFNDMDSGSVHIQGFTINVPLGRTKINRIGSQHAFSRVGNYPLNVEIVIRGIVSDLKNSPLHSLHLSDTCGAPTFDLEIKMNDGFCISLCKDNSIKHVDSSMYFNIKNARLDSEAFTLDLDSHKMVDVKFTAAIVGPDKLDEGFFISGRSYMPNKPKIISWGNLL